MLRIAPRRVGVQEYVRFGYNNHKKTYGQYKVVAYMYFTSTIITIFFINVYVVLFLFNNVIYVFLLYDCMFMYDYPD
jgi:hypothetical protein